MIETPKHARSKPLPGGGRRDCFPLWSLGLLNHAGARDLPTLNRIDARRYCKPDDCDAGYHYSNDSQMCCAVRIVNRGGHRWDASFSPPLPALRPRVSSDMFR